MLFYIDPGTGSMLFTILIGVLGAAIYGLRNVWMKLRFLAGGGRQAKTDANRTPFVFFTDSKRYQTIFQPLCEEMDRRGESVLYLTASPDDPLLQENYAHVKCEFIGEGNSAFARMNMIRADIVLSSTPGLDVYQWKRSRDVKWYVHVLHAANDVTMYRMFGIDYYDAVMISGAYMEQELREMEAQRNLPAKEVRMAGLPHMDALRKRLLESGAEAEHEKTVLLAPSWGSNSILQKYGEKIFEALLKTDYHVIVRPHPQSFVSEKELIDRLMAAYPESDKLEWNRDTDNFDVLKRSDILISDYSGVMFDYSLVFDRPLVYADTQFDNSVYDAWWMKEEPWTFRILDKLGVQLTEDRLENLGELLDDCRQNPGFREGREQARRDTWENIGNSVESIADYLIEKRAALQPAEDGRKAGDPI